MGLANVIVIKEDKEMALLVPLAGLRTTAADKVRDDIGWIVTAFFYTFLDVERHL